MREWPEKSMYVDYRPEGFCREFAAIRGHASMLYNYMAVVTGVKPLLDDWIPVERFEDFERTCRKKYGLSVRAGAVWLYEISDEYLAGLSSGGSLSTTKFMGARYRKGLKDGNLHVFVAGDKEALERGYRSGWYPLIINGRIVHKPYVDYLRFGLALGYPECCVDYFARENPLGDFLFKIYSGHAGQGDYRCNCLAKDTSYSYIYHMPCSAHCAETIRYVDNLRAEIRKQDPLYAELIDRHLKAPFLVFSEQDIYAFEGTVFGNRILSAKSHFVGKPRYNRYNEMLREADTVVVEDGEIKAFKSGELLISIKKDSPEKGTIIHFSG